MSISNNSGVSNTPDIPDDFDLSDEFMEYKRQIIHLLDGNDDEGNKS